MQLVLVADPAYQRWEQLLLIPVEAEILWYPALESHPTKTLERIAMGSHDDLAPLEIDHTRAMGMVIRPHSISSLPDLASAFAREGYLGDVPHDYKLRRLKKSLGSARYDQSQDIQTQRDKKMAEGRFDEAPSENELYRLLKTSEEAHLFYSIQLEISQAANAAAYDVLIRNLPDASVVADVGCFTGSFVRYIASRHPSFSVHGLDHLPNLIDIARTATSQDNASFSIWNYASDDSAPTIRANAITSIFAVPLSEILGPEDIGGFPEDPTQAPAFTKAMALVKPMATNWSKIAADDATLCLVTRAGTPPLMLAVVEGCRQAGWQLRKQATQVIKTPQEAVPLFLFDKASKPNPRCTLNALEGTALWLAGLVA